MKQRWGEKCVIKRLKASHHNRHFTMYDCGLQNQTHHIFELILPVLARELRTLLQRTVWMSIMYLTVPVKDVPHPQKKESMC